MSNLKFHHIQRQGPCLTRPGPRRKQFKFRTMSNQKNLCRIPFVAHASADYEEQLEQEEVVEQHLPTMLRYPFLWNKDGYDEDDWRETYEINNKFSQEPDFDDPEWHEKVTDWGEFWNYQKWDTETDGLDDEHDVSGNPVNSPERVMKLFAALKDMRSHSNVQHFAPIANFRENLSIWENPPVPPDVIPQNPAYTISDLRAISEKRRRKDIMDKEWRRRQSLVGLLQYPDPYQLDVRLQEFADVNGLDWSEERTYQLLTMNGLAAKPEAHQAYIENPLVPVDYVQTLGVEHIEDTEDFLESLGRLANPREVDDFDQEVLLDAMAFMGWDGDDLAEDILATESAEMLAEQEEFEEEGEDNERDGYDGEGEDREDVEDNEEYDDAGEYEVVEADEGSSFDDELDGGDVADEVDE